MLCVFLIPHSRWNKNTINHKIIIAEREEKERIINLTSVARVIVRWHENSYYRAEMKASKQKYAT